MDLSQSVALVTAQGGEFRWLSEAPSTNSLLLANSQLPHFSVFATDNQTSGRGRAGRVWQAPAGASLAVSVLLRPSVAANLNHLGWLPLLAGLAMTKTVNTWVGNKAAVKWPNDVLVADRKITGVLSEMTPDFTAVVIGAGLNIFLSEADLPVETATSLLIEGAENLSLDALLANYLANLNSLYKAFEKNQFDPNRSGLRQAVIENCTTINRKVRAILPGDSQIEGTAVTIEDTGRLVIMVEGNPVAVAAGDIVHMRHN